MRTRFGEYFIEEKIAVGGMAEIYRAQTTYGDPVAIKMILPEYSSQAKFVQMFLDEARIVVSLSHPNVVRLLDFGKVGGTYFFSMEWIDGKALSTIVQKQTEKNIPFPVDVALFMVIDACKGLFYAHNKADRFKKPLHIVHRDISPSNLLVTREALVKIADFGIAHARGKEIETQPGVIRGKYSYMSPEQTYGGDFDHRSDIFSLGTVLFELLSSTRLFLRDSDIATIDAVRQAKVPSLRRFNRMVSEDLEEIVMRALDQNPRKRFASAEVLSEELQKVLAREFAKTNRQYVSEFLKILFPSESFSGATKSADRLLHELKERWREQGVPSPTPLAKLNRKFEKHPYVASAAFALLSILAAELFF